MNKLNYLTEQQIIKLLGEKNKIVISGHHSPDGDCLGSQLGLFYYLKSINKKVFLLNSDPVPENLIFLQGSDKFFLYKPEEHDELIAEADLIIVTDVNDTSRTGAIGDSLTKSSAEKLVIDHHIEPDDFADYYYVDTEAASCGQLIWKITDKDKNYQTSRAAAEALYVAIMTDTGSFRFPRTDGEVHRIIAELIDCGAKPEDMFEFIYNNVSDTAFKLSGLAMSRLDLHFGGKLGFIGIESEDFDKLGAKQSDTENIVERIMSVAGVKVGIFIRQSPDSNFLRVSLRSKDEYSVRDVATQFGGGGHFHAAGARLYDIDFDSGVKMILKAAGKMIESV